MERVKSSSLRTYDRSEFCPFTSETGNWPQIDCRKFFFCRRKEKKESSQPVHENSILHFIVPIPDINTNTLNIAAERKFLRQPESCNLA